MSIEKMDEVIKALTQLTTYELVAVRTQLGKVIDDRGYHEQVLTEGRATLEQYPLTEMEKATATKRDRFIEAIKLLRNRTGLGLRESKNCIEYYRSLVVLED